MFVDELRAVLARVAKLFVVSLAFLGLIAPVASAQEQEEEEAAPAAQERDTDIEEVVVTGSRLKRDTFSSIAPLQVITTQAGREIGTIDASTILQESTSAAGTQFDLTINGFVTENGPGSSTIDLRGLGASRTLVLINGRRAAPAGVEGAPISPDLNLVPSTLVQQYEILLDGASSVYGSDAIAGVSNIIMRKDFDGLEVEGFSTFPEESNGVSNTISVAWGRVMDRGFFGIGAEYSESEEVTFDDRPWTEGCNKHMEIDDNGQVRNEFLTYEFDYGMQTSPCKIGFGRRSWDNYNGFGSIYRTPGESNIGIPNLSEATLWGFALDQNQDGSPDVDFLDYNVNGELGEGHMFPELERTSIMAYGEYTFSGESNITAYFEANWNEREVYVYNPGSVIFQEVPADNPFNPCNPNGIDGVSCLHAYDDVLLDPVFAADFAAIYGATPFFFADQFGLTWLFNDWPGAQDPTLRTPTATPLEAQFSVTGDRDDVWSKVNQVRLVAGFNGDLPGIDWGSVDNWSFDVALVHSDSNGDSRRRGVNEQNLLYSLNTTTWDPVSGDISCGNGSDCVPVNLFAPSLYEGLINNSFASQAEADFLFINRDFDTQYKQTMLNALVTGDLFEMPGGTAAAAIGIEIRRDEIDSIPNEAAAEGLLWGYFADRGAVGEKTTNEFFAELEMPLFAGNPGMEELTVNVSTRYTKDEFYSGHWTYSAKLAYRPIDSLLIRGTTGTSYRAPNLRENFMLGQTGFRTLFDPCVVPEDALTINGYDPTQDDREQHILDNCTAQGIDPTTLGQISSNQSSANYSVEVAGAGRQNLNEEKSESWTAGFAFEQPWFEAFDLTIGGTYYDIEINDEIIRLHSQYSINDCYNDLEGDSAFCTNITREDLGGGALGLMTFTDEAFLNQDAKKTRGIDWNLSLDIPTQAFGRALDIGMDIVANRKLEFTEIFVNPFNGIVDEEEYTGEFGFPEWTAHGQVRFDMGKWRLTWSSRYIDGVEQDPLGIDAPGNVPDGTADTCLGPDFGDVNCRDIGYADHYFRHDMSLFWRGDVWTFGAGVRNLKNEWPPQVDSQEVSFVFNNTPMGRGYDTMGRTYYVNIAAAFQ
jgi:iron complex outermembrane receptor protein